MPSMLLISTVFPDPFGPMTATLSPSSMSKLTSRRIGRRSSVTERACTWTIAMPPVWYAGSGEGHRLRRRFDGFLDRGADHGEDRHGRESQQAFGGRADHRLVGEALLLRSHHQKIGAEVLDAVEHAFRRAAAQQELAHAADGGGLLAQPHLEVFLQPRIAVVNALGDMDDHQLG